MSPHLPKLMPILVRELRCSEAINRQNAAFACGVLAAGCGGAAMAPFYPTLLQVGRVDVIALQQCRRLLQLGWGPMALNHLPLTTPGPHGTSPGTPTPH